MIQDYKKQFKELKNTKILVTGGAGFIGSNLCEILLELESNVICLDNLSTGKLSNIEPFFENENFKFIQGDIRNIDNCIEACVECDYILHQAALGSVPRSIKDPITTNEVNISGFLNMLLAAKSNNIKRFVFAASSSTYGDSTFLPKIEENIGKPLSPYAITKYVNELYAEIFSKLYNLNIIGLRYFNVFGKRQDPDGMYAAVIPKFILSLIKNESPVINGDGSYSRDFTYIDNVVQMNLLAITSKNKNAINQIYNTAYGENTTLNELYNILKLELSKFDNKIELIEPIYGSFRQGDIPHSLASIEKAKKLLNYIPKYNIHKGIKCSIRWYWENFKK